jgi:hypothetical protein
MWLEGTVRPPFCSRGNRTSITGRNVGCRYCWPETCLWEKFRTEHGESIEGPVAGITNTGRHRMPHRVGALRSLLRMHRRAQEPTEEERSD